MDDPIRVDVQCPGCVEAVAENEVLKQEITGLKDVVGRLRAQLQDINKLRADLWRFLHG